MTRIVDIKDIIQPLSAPTYERALDITIGTDTVLTTADMLLELEYTYHDMSFVSHKAADDVDTFLTHWNIYKKRYSAEWERIYNDVALTQSADYNPMLQYSETKTITPDIEVESSTEYGHIITGSGSSSLGHGMTVTDQTNTYDGALRDGSKSTQSGTDTTTASNTDTHSGTDTNTTTTTGSTTETKEGYRDNPLDNLQRDIDFTFRNNLRDLIINNFARDYLFYNNENKEGCCYGIFY